MCMWWKILTEQSVRITLLSNGYNQDDAREVYHSHEVLRERGEELRKMLQRLEWSDNDLYMKDKCPCCGGFQPGQGLGMVPEYKYESIGHDYNCELDKMISGKL